MMINVFLHGTLGARFGALHRRDVTSAADAVRALCWQIEGFRAALALGAWRVMRGDAERGYAHTVDDLHAGLSRGPLHIVPAVEGAGGPVGRIILGGALIAASFFVAGPVGSAAAALGLSASIGASVASATFAIGASLALGGITQMLAPKPAAAKTQPSPEERQSGGRLLDAFGNRIVQGQPVPLAYGRVRVEGLLVATSLTVEDVAP